MTNEGSAWRIYTAERPTRRLLNIPKATRPLAHYKCLKNISWQFLGFRSSRAGIKPEGQPIATAG